MWRFQTGRFPSPRAGIAKRSNMTSGVGKFHAQGRLIGRWRLCSTGNGRPDSAGRTPPVSTGSGLAFALLPKQCLNWLHGQDLPHATQTKLELRRHIHQRNGEMGDLTLYAPDPLRPPLMQVTPLNGGESISGITTACACGRQPTARLKIVYAILVHGESGEASGDEGRRYTARLPCGALSVNLGDQNRC